MVVKRPLSSPATLQDFNTLEKRLVRKSVSKQELQGELEELTDHLNQKLDDKFNSVMNKLDFIVGQLETQREENIVGAHQVHELRLTTSDHEKRIKKLESPRS